MAITSTMKHPSNSLVSNIRGQPLVIWKLIHAAIFGFDSDLQVKLFGGNGNVVYEHDMFCKCGCRPTKAPLNAAIGPFISLLLQRL